MELYPEWESEDTKEIFHKFVGDAYGEEPGKQVETIKKSKENHANHIIRVTGISLEDTVLEIGSGFGFESKIIAQASKELHCCDVSETFLKFAKKECCDIKNIFFHKIDKRPADLHFIKSNSIDVVFSSAVFIHLNLFDIYCYFEEFQRVVKRRGVLYFNIACCDYDFDQNNNRKFLQMVGCYKQNEGKIGSLMQWNSRRAVVDIAKSFGFEITKYRKSNFLLLLNKTV